MPRDRLEIRLCALAGDEREIAVLGTGQEACPTW